MQQTRKNIRLVLVGGGHAHIEVLRSWNKNIFSNVQIYVISPDLESFYSGMLPAYIADDFTKEEISINIANLARKAEAKLFLNSVVRLCSKEQKLFLDNGLEIYYDYVSFNIGSKSKDCDLNDVRIISTRPFYKIFKKLSDWDESITLNSDQEIVCIGAGIAGFELCLALQSRYRKRIKKNSLQFAIVDSSKRLNSLQRKYLNSRNIQIYQHSKFLGIDAKSSKLKINFENKDSIQADKVLLATGPNPINIFENSGLSTVNGYLAVDDCLRSTQDKNIFGAGDCIHLSSYPKTDKAGVFAVREAPFLLHNLEASIRSTKLKKYKPQKNYLKIMNLSDGSALMQYSFLQWRSQLCWEWKNHIDQAFMQKYKQFPLKPMNDPNCGACGCKVNSSSLSSAIMRNDFFQNKNISLGIDKKDDIALVKTTDSYFGITIDQFKEFDVNPYVFGKIAAVNACSDLYAKGMQVEYALVNLCIHKFSENLAEEEVYLYLSGVSSILNEEQVSVIGGHTIEAQEAQLGLVAISTDKFRWNKQGTQASDCLILTKALGTGVVLAANMRNAVSAETFAQTIQQMCLSQQKAMQLLLDYPVHAVTDVTGFGLAGHMNEMLSGTNHTVNWLDIPIIKGVKELLELGYESRMSHQNRQSFPSIGNSAIFYDPQTSGGLLISIEEKYAEDCCKKLQQSYPETKIIGTIS